MMEDHSTDSLESEDRGFKGWLEDNLRVLLSLLVVAAIAGGIYSYSQRSQGPELAQEDEASMDTPATSSDSDEEEPEAPAAPTPAKVNGTQPAKAPVAAPAGEIRETETAFTVSAARGNGTTHLARQALASHLAKNPDSQLTKEHKIYIEDYLRKHVAFRGSVHVGTSVEFQKSLINEAIAKAKTLNEHQLNNLKKYSARVPSLS